MEGVTPAGDVRSGRHVVDLLRVGVLRGRTGRPRKEEADRQTGRGRDRERHGIAGRFAAGRDQHRAPAAEVQRVRLLDKLLVAAKLRS
jgi:hypothetical protein